MKERLLRYWAYFRRGHNVYLYFFMSFLNFLVIQWTFLISTFDPLATLLQNLLIFSTVFLLTYIPLSTIIGWIDFKRGAVPVDQTIGAQANPWYQDLAKAILLLAEGKNQEVIEVMKKWVKKETR